MILDDAVTAIINSLSGKSDLADLVMRAITVVGPFVLVVLVAIRWFSRARLEECRHLAIACGMATALGLIFNQIILLFYHRPRPYESGITHLILEKSADPSFPSDHATVGFAIATCLILAKGHQRFLVMIFALVICFSRIYLGTHYFTDVLGGATTGAVAAFMITRIYDRFLPITQKLVKIL